VPYKATNRKKFVTQMCAYLDRQDRLMLAEDVGAWIHQRRKDMTKGYGLNKEASGYAAFLERMKREAEQNKQLEVRLVSRLLRGHIWHTVRPDLSGVTLQFLVNKYQIHGLLEDVLNFLGVAGSDIHRVAVAEMKYDAWFRCRIQVPKVQDEDTLLEPRTLQALPPFVSKTKYGLCNCALVNEDGDTTVVGVAGNSNPIYYYRSPLTSHFRSSCSSSPLDLPTTPTFYSPTSQHAVSLRLLVLRSETRCSCSH